MAAKGKRKEPRYEAQVNSLRASLPQKGQSQANKHAHQQRKR